MSLRHDNIRMVIIDSQIIISSKHSLLHPFVPSDAIPGAANAILHSLIVILNTVTMLQNMLQNLYNLSMKFCNVTILHPNIFKCSYISAREI